MRSWTFAKGQATLNDYLVIVDRHGMLAPTADDVRFLCDRRLGLGADGLLRAIRAEHIPEWEGDGAVWFMDSRNADGTPSAVMGNGLRVFARFLAEEGLLGGDEAVVATRSGARRVRVLPEGRIETSLGEVTFTDLEGEDGEGEVGLAGAVHPAVGLRIASGLHAVSAVRDPAALDFTGLRVGPAVTNVECYEQTGPAQLTMRQWERGIGETVSCGTGAVAAVATWLRERGEREGRAEVIVRGGRLEASVREVDGTLHGTLVGPAVIVARGDVAIPDAS